uniref:Uncharacterized protein n=1 Tax=Panagrolaimus sp. JU765 TaxID=591449 RepID=A0AC34QRR2_9BILA
MFLGDICEGCTPTQTYIPRGEPGANGSNVTLPVGVFGRRKRSTEARILMEINSQNMTEIEEIIGNSLKDSKMKVRLSIQINSVNQKLKLGIY